MMGRATWKILILLQIIGLSLAREFVPESEALFTECLEPPPGSKSVEAVADFSKLTVKRVKDGMDLSGNITTVWSVGSDARIEVDIAILKQERGNWVPTVLAAHVKDFCKDMYDKNSLYYPYSMKYIANKPDVKDKCLTNPGTVILVEPYTLKVVLGVAVPLQPGPHRIVVKFTAFNKAGVQNPENICFELPGKIV